MQKQLYK